MATLQPYRNREAAFALAVFLSRFWSVPGRVAGTFPIDRRELADRQDLGLTEAQVRGGIRVLEEVGFLDRQICRPGSRYKATEHGLHRKPILFAFGSEYAPAFIKANGRAAAARGGRSGDRRAIMPSAAPMPSKPPVDGLLKSPKSRIHPEGSMLMGQVRKECGLPAKAFVPDPALEAALARLEEGFRQSRGGGGEGSAR